jgi:hypothetical protein
MKAFKEWLIGYCGGYTEKQFREGQEIAQGLAYRYYLNLRREELMRDLQRAVKWRRKHSDIESRLKSVTAELVEAENATL